MATNKIGQASPEKTNVATTINNPTDCNQSNLSPNPGAYLNMNNIQTEANTLSEMLSSPSLRRHSFDEAKSNEANKDKEIPKWLQYTLLIATSTICFGNYYVYDFPQALQTPFNDKLHIGPNDTNLFYSAYGLPNTV